MEFSCMVYLVKYFRRSTHTNTFDTASKYISVGILGSKTLKTRELFQVSRWHYHCSIFLVHKALVQRLEKNVVALL